MIESAFATIFNKSTSGFSEKKIIDTEQKFPKASVVKIFSKSIFVFDLKMWRNIQRRF